LFHNRQAVAHSVALKPLVGTCKDVCATHPGCRRGSRIRDVVADILELSDYRVMTAANGAEALAQIRVEVPAVQAKLGVQGYLAKPFEPEAVLAVVDRLATGDGVN
jgi:CheY-like chemotaxis protein